MLSRTWNRISTCLEKSASVKKKVRFATLLVRFATLLVRFATLLVRFATLLVRLWLEYKQMLTLYRKRDHHLTEKYGNDTWYPPVATTNGQNPTQCCRLFQKSINQPYIDNPNYYYLSRKQNLLNKYSTGTDTGTPLQSYLTHSWHIRVLINCKLPEFILR